jgi:hypothetical protein
MPDAGVNGARIWYQEIGFGTKKPVKAILWYRSTVPGLVTSIFPQRLLFSRRHDPSGPAPGYWTATRPEWTIRSNLQKPMRLRCSDAWICFFCQSTSPTCQDAVRNNLSKIGPKGDALLRQLDCG